MEYLVKNFKNRGSKMIFCISCYLQTEIAKVDHAKMVENVQTVVMDSNVCVPPGWTGHMCEQGQVSNAFPLKSVYLVVLC